MSASLVGSEMCIRDRSRRVHFLASAISGQRGLFLQFHAGLVSCCPGGGPVSYTHLTLPTICSV
eukprot:332045-Alexandrium_andersonii.AAC.1